MSKYLMKIFFGLMFILFSTASSGIDFGDYTTSFESSANCRGSKKHNLTEMQAVFVINPKTGQGYAFGNSTNKSNGGLLRGKTRTWKWNGEKFEFLVSFSIKDICLNPDLKMYILDKFVMVDNQCHLIKGFKVFHDVDLSTSARVVIGPKAIFFGKFKTEISSYTINGNSICFVLIYKVLKK